MNEQDLARLVVEHLRAEGYEVYQEVSLGAGEPTADIVAIQGPLLHVVECKTTLSLAVLSQAIRWIGAANLVSVAVPSMKKKAGFGMGAAEWTMRRAGIGWFSVAEPSRWQHTVNLLLRPALQRRRTNSISRHLCEEQKTFAPAGNADGLAFSPFRRTKQRLSTYVQDHPNCTVKEAVEAIAHHYASNLSARQSLVRWIREGSVDGVRVVEGRPLRLEVRNS